MASNKGILDLVFPTGGVARQHAFQSQAPYTTPDCLNVRPIETIKGRERGGSRPGLVRAFQDALPDSVNLLSGVTYVETDAIQDWSDTFDGATMGDAWSAATWLSASLPDIFPGDYSQVAYNQQRGAVLKALTFNATADYQAEIFIAPYNGQHCGTYQIFARMNNTTPVATTDGIVAELTINDATGAYSGSLKVYVSGVLTATHAFTGTTLSATKAGWFKVLIHGNDVSCYWCGTAVLSATTVAAAAGARVGFSMNCTVAGGACLVDIFRLEYKVGTKAQVRKRVLVAGSSGNIYKQQFSDRMVTIGGSIHIASDRGLQAAELNQKLYVADYGDPAALGTDGVISGTYPDRLSAASVADWTALGISTTDMVVVVSSPLGGAVADTYEIASVTSGYLQLAAVCGTGGTCSYKVARCPKVYDPSANTLIRLRATSGKGQVPTSCRLACNYRGRLVLGSPDDAPHAFFQSRSGDPLDWDYGADSTDGSRAVAGASTDAGIIGQVLTALIPHNDDYLVLGCETSLWVQRGDLAYGGSIHNLSYQVGIVNKNAWCRGPQGEIVFLSRAGLYVLPSGASSVPVSISEQIPIELLNIDQNSYTALLAFDQQYNGVHIYLTSSSGKGRLHYWLDWSSKSFWPVQLNSLHEPFSTYEYTAENGEDSGVLLGCRDGWIRRYRDEQETDDGTAFTSYCFYGPIRLGGDGYHDGLVAELIGVPAAGSGPVAFSVHVGQAHESALASTARAAGTWSVDSLNFKRRPRVRGAAFYLKLANSGSRRWAMERITAAILRGGVQRL